MAYTRLGKWRYTLSGSPLGQRVIVRISARMSRTTVRSMYMINPDSQPPILTYEYEGNTNYNGTSNKQPNVTLDRANGIVKDFSEGSALKSNLAHHE